MTVYHGQSPPDRSDELRADIVEARAELGRTLQALAERADVRARARTSAARAAQRARAIWRAPTPWLVLTAGLAAAGVAVLLTRGRRR